MKTTLQPVQITTKVIVLPRPAPLVPVFVQKWGKVWAVEWVKAV